eukprot:jgi/Ulvmu1/5288/UM022_0082.1
MQGRTDLCRTPHNVTDWSSQWVRHAVPTYFHYTGHGCGSIEQQAGCCLTSSDCVQSGCHPCASAQSSSQPDRKIENGLKLTLLGTGTSVQDVASSQDILTTSTFGACLQDVTALQGMTPSPACGLAW